MICFREKPKPGRAPKPGHAPKPGSVLGEGLRPPKPPLRILRGLRPLKLPHSPPTQPRVGDGDDGGDDDGRIFQEHPSPIIHAPRDIISRKGKSLTPTYIYIYIYI